MSNMSVHYSSANSTWETPPVLFNDLNHHWHFTLDPASESHTALCKKYYTSSMDGLEQDWSDDIFFLNPPYGRVIKKWLKKAAKSYEMGGTGVCLVPSRTDTLYIHESVFDKATAVCFIKGRLKFTNSYLPAFSRKIPEKERPPAPFPSMLVIYDDDFTSSKFDCLSKYGKVYVQ